MIRFRNRNKEFIGVALIGAGSKLSLESIDNFYRQISDMYLDRDERKAISGDGFEGVVRSNGQFCHIGGLGGVEYRGELDVEGFDRPIKLSYLICEKVDAGLN